MKSIDNSESLSWYVVYTKPRWEKKVSKILGERNIENYCPLNKVKKQWSDRKKIVLEPLFKGYVFVRISPLKKWDVRLVPGIINYVHWLGKPAALKEEEINSIKKFLEEFSDIEVIDSQLNAKDAVIIKRGIFMNFKGFIIEILGNKAMVNIDSMGIKLSAIFEKNNLLSA